MIFQLPVFHYLFLSDLTKLENNRLPAAVIMCHPPIQADGTPPWTTHTYVCFKPETSTGPRGNCINLSLSFSQVKKTTTKKHDMPTETKRL